MSQDHTATAWGLEMPLPKMALKMGSRFSGEETRPPPSPCCKANRLRDKCESAGRWVQFSSCSTWQGYLPGLSFPICTMGEQSTGQSTRTEPNGLDDPWCVREGHRTDEVEPHHETNRCPHEVWVSSLTSANLPKPKVFGGPLV